MDQFSLVTLYSKVLLLHIYRIIINNLLIIRFTFICCLQAGTSINHIGINNLLFTRLLFICFLREAPPPPQKIKCLPQWSRTTKAFTPPPLAQWSQELFCNALKKVVFPFVVRGFTIPPPSPLSGPTTKKTLFVYLRLPLAKMVEYYRLYSS